MLRSSPKLFFVSVALTVMSLAAPAAASENGDILIGRAASEQDVPGGTTGPLLVAIDTPYEVFDDAGTLVHVAAWSRDGRPAAGASVYLGGRRIGRADDSGTFVFRWGVSGNDIADYWTGGSTIHVRWDDDGEAYAGNVWFSAQSRTPGFASDHLYVYADRGIYAPGDEVQLRLIGWSLAEDFSPLDGAEVEVTLRGPSGGVAAGAGVTTDSFGVAHGALRVPPSADEGVYTLEVAHEGAVGSVRLQVERFVPPAIEIDHTIGRFLTRDQTDLPFEVRLAYFTGGSPDRATVTTTLRAGDTRWSSHTVVEGEGPHPITIPAEALDTARDGLSDGALAVIDLRVEDNDGRVDELTRELRYTANPYVAIVEADRGAYSPGDPVELVVRITDRDRVPVRATELRMTTSRGDTLEATTDAGGAAVFSLVMADDGFDAEVFIDGVDNALARHHVAWQAPQPMRSHIASPVVTEGQDTPIRITFPAGFEPVEDVVHVDIVDTSGSLMNAVLVPIVRDGDEVYAEGSFEAPSWGSMLLTIFCLGRETDATLPDDPERTHLGVLTEGQNLVVQAGRELHIVLDGVPDEAAPGAAIAAGVRVTDASGAPVDAALGVAVVDGAVISLKDPLEITPMDLFYNPELRTIATTGSAILTWPVVSRNWGGQLHDIALPPFPFRDGGPIQRSPDLARGTAAGDPEAAIGMGSSDMVTISGGGSGMGMAAPAAAPMMAASLADPSGDYDFEDVSIAGELTEASNLQTRRGAASVAAAPPVTITVRTEFPETALWAPDLRATSGAGRFEVDLPDAITRQHVMIVASDRNGGVGVLRQDVSVTQPVFVRSDLPATLTVGDAIDVAVAARNLSDAAVEVSIDLLSDHLDVIPLAGPPLRAAPGEAAVQRFRVRASTVGEAEFRIVAEAGGHRDEAVQTVEIRPAGSPRVDVSHGSLSAESSFGMVLDRIPTAAHTTWTLDVSFPAVTADFEGADAVLAQLEGDDEMSLAGDLVSAIILTSARRAAGRDTAAWEAKIQDAIGRLASAQRPDGGWGFWWDQGSGAYVTGWVVEALLEARASGFVVDDSTISVAMDWLATRLAEGPIDQEEIAFWEGNTDAVRLALSAELFHLLARAPEALRSATVDDSVATFARRATDIIESADPDILAFAHALGGLLALPADHAAALDAETRAASVRRLSTTRREAHWEPSWFNAYGGTIEATVVALQILRDSEAPDVDGWVRDAARYLMSTRDAWGHWHSPRGTAWALRGLAMAGGLEREVASTVEVRHGDVVVASVAIDPRDPYLSALPLRAFDVSGYADDTTPLRVTYDGNLQPQVRLVRRSWGVAAADSAGARAEPATARVGERVGLALDLRPTHADAAAVEIDVPAVLAVDQGDLARRVEAGDFLSWSLDDDRLRVQLGSAVPEVLTVHFSAARAGQARFGRIVIRYPDPNAEGGERVSSAAPVEVSVGD